MVPYVKLLFLQVLVAVVCVTAWYVFSTFPIKGTTYLLDPFFFSTPHDVVLQIIKWFVQGTIWKHLWVTLVEAILAL